ncbi:hypothetical protein TNCV_2825201 [Trichonephila clavipes]|nr:hypothetical protein TNCV_2825201 [Trichonephila clavipes]
MELSAAWIADVTFVPCRVYGKKTAQDVYVILRNGGLVCALQIHSLIPTRKRKSLTHRATILYCSSFQPLCTYVHINLELHLSSTSVVLKLWFVESTHVTKTKKPLSTVQSLNVRVQYGYEKEDLHSAILQKYLARMYPLCMIVARRGQAVVQPQENRVPGDQMRGKAGVYGVGQPCIVLSVQQ